MTHHNINVISFIFTNNGIICHLIYRNALLKKASSKNVLQKSLHPSVYPASLAKHIS